MYIVAILTQGESYYVRNRKRYKIKVRTIFNKDDTIIIKNGRTRIQVGPSAIISIRKNTTLQLKKLLYNNGVYQFRMSMRRGSTFHRVIKNKKYRYDYSVKTPTTIAGIRGTEFIVNEKVVADKKKQPESGVFVFSGIVNIAFKKQNFDLNANEQVTFKKNRAVRKKLSKKVKKQRRVFKGMKAMNAETFNKLRQGPGQLKNKKENSSNKLEQGKNRLKDNKRQLRQNRRQNQRMNLRKNRRVNRQNRIRQRRGRERLKKP